MIRSFIGVITAVLCSFQGFAQQKPEPVYPVVVLGSGVGSLTSALYLARAGIEPLVIEGQNPGGLITQSHTVQNWPGEFDIEGYKLTDKIRKQVESNGAQFVREKVIKVDFSKRPFKLTLATLDGEPKERTISAESCIIAMGTEPNFLNIPGEKDYWGKGVTNCAICDGTFYRDQIVGVAGGGDAAVLEALYLSNIAKEVHVFVRKGGMKAVEEKRLAALRQKPNVIFHYNTTVEQVEGNGEKVTGVVLNGEKNLALDGLFLAIGSKPNSQIFKNALELDEQGYIVLKKDMQTNVAGVFAIGDIVDPVYKQAISAAGDGAKAAMQAQQYISDRENQLIAKSEVVSLLRKKAAIEITSEDQFYEELNSGMPVVVDFYADWCGPCRSIAPDIESTASELSKKVKFLKVNVDKMSNLAQSYKVRSMPTVILFDAKGKVKERKVGTDQIHSLLNSLKNQ